MLDYTMYECAECIVCISAYGNCYGEGDIFPTLFVNFLVCLMQESSVKSACMLCH